MVKLNYSTSFDPRTGEPLFLTPCPWLRTNVGSNECVSCRHFGGVTKLQVVECYNTETPPLSYEE